MMDKIRITTSKKYNWKTRKTKKNHVSLRIKKMNQSIEHKSTPQVLGMIKKVAHLLKIEEVK